MISSWIFSHVSFGYEVAQGYYKAQFQVPHNHAHPEINHAPYGDLRWTGRLFLVMQVLHEDLKPSAENHHVGLVNGHAAEELAASLHKVIYESMHACTHRQLHALYGDSSWLAGLFMGASYSYRHFHALYGVLQRLCGYISGCSLTPALLKLGTRHPTLRHPYLEVANFVVSLACAQGGGAVYEAGQGARTTSVHLTFAVEIHVSNILIRAGIYHTIGVVQIIMYEAGQGARNHLHAHITFAAILYFSNILTGSGLAIVYNWRVLLVPSELC
jgi:hypothetical protein